MWTGTLKKQPSNFQYTAPGLGFLTSVLDSLLSHYQHAVKDLQFPKIERKVIKLKLLDISDILITI